MGSRRPGSFRSFAGRGKRTIAGVNRVNDSIARRVATDVVVGTAVGVLSTTVPVVGAAVAGYQAAEMVYGAYKAGNRTYARTGDRDTALEAAGRSIAKSVGKVAAEHALGAAVSSGWTTAKEVAHLSTSRTADRVIEAAAGSTIESLAGQWKPKKRR